MPDLGFSLDVWPWVWLVIGVVVVLVELTVLGGSLMVLPFGVSALVAAVLAFSGVDVGIQWLVFGVGGGVLFLVFWRYQSLVQRGNQLPPGVGAVRLVGLTAVVTRTIDPASPDVPGQVVVDGETWGATTDHPDAMTEGARVRITDMRGTRVVVEPISHVPEARDAHPPPPTARPEDS